MLNRHFSLVIAALLPLLLFGWFAPSPIGQLDFWLLWLVAMLGVGLPLLFAEIGLAYRSAQPPVMGMQALTRQADASVIWRSFAWLSVFGALLLAALSIDSASTDILKAFSELGIKIDIPVFALAVGMVVIATLLSLLGRVTALISLVLIFIALMIGMASGFAPLNFAMTDVTLNEWARAVMLALVSVGIGTGLYWFVSTSTVSSQSIANTKPTPSKPSAAKVVLPIWFTQLITGAAALILTSTTLSSIGHIIYALGVLAIAGYLIHYASSQLATKFGIWIALIITMIVTVALVVIGTPSILTLLLTLFSLITGLVLALFTGWQMKISHMRKSLNFSSEGMYNVWRVAIRLLAPLMIITATIGWIQQWVS